jgi:hypothetical protein
MIFVFYHFSTGKHKSQTYNVLHVVQVFLLLMYDHTSFDKEQIINKSSNFNSYCVYYTRIVVTNNQYV